MTCPRKTTEPKSNVCVSAGERLCVSVHTKRRGDMDRHFPPLCPPPRPAEGLEGRGKPLLLPQPKAAEGGAWGYSLLLSLPHRLGPCRSPQHPKTLGVPGRSASFSTGTGGKASTPDTAGSLLPAFSSQQSPLPAKATLRFARSWKGSEVITGQAPDARVSLQLLITVTPSPVLWETTAARRVGVWSLPFGRASALTPSGQPQ